MERRNGYIRSDRAAEGTDMSIPNSKITIKTSVTVAETDLVFQDEAVLELNAVTSVDVIGRELAIDTIEVTVKQLPGAAVPLNDVPYATQMLWHFGTTLKGLFYFKTAEQIGKHIWRISGVSFVGLLDKMQYDGYFATGQTFGQILNSMLAPVTTFSIEAQASNIKVFGLLESGNRREALHKLLASYGVTIQKNSLDGRPRFRFLTNTDAEEIDADVCYAEGSSAQGEVVSAVNVTEHRYQDAPGVERKLLFDCSAANAAAEYYVRFDEPIVPYSIVHEGEYELITASALWIKFRGRCKIYGRPYLHTQNIIRIENEDAPFDNEVNVTDFYLASQLNSENIAERLMEFYKARRTVKVAFKQTDEACGERYQFTNAAGDQEEGFLVKMDMTPSSFIKADCEILSGYVPKAFGNTWNNVTVVSQNTTFQIPEGVKKIHVVLIGHGQAGSAGQAGQTGGQANDYTGGAGGAGGEGGTGGAGGPIYERTIDVTGVPSVSLVIGNDVIIRPTSGASWEYRSSDGSASEFGYYDIIGGETYALPGKNGEAGSAGGKGGYFDINRYEPASAGEPFYGDFSHIGYGGNSSGPQRVDYGPFYGMIGGRAGGGGAYGANGANGSTNFDSNTGARGANAAAPESTRPGFGHGGNGGNGGGGGAGGTDRAYYNTEYGTLNLKEYTNPGAGGSGSYPTSERPGCALIYT